MSSRLLIDFPPEVTNKILSKLDIFSVLKLRKVCYDLRQFIDENPPKPICWEVKASTFNESSSIKFESPKNIIISFKPIEKGCVMSWRNDDYVFKFEEFLDESYMDVFSRELGLIMKHHSRAGLDSFLIELYQGEHDYIEREEEDQENNIRMLNLQEIRQLDQWQNSKRVKVEVNDFNVRIQDFLHFEEVGIDCMGMPVQDIILLKESFLTSPTLTSFNILIHAYFDEREQLHASFGLPVGQDNSDEKWFFRIPDNKEVLSVTLTMADRFIFRRIEMKDVPKSTVIRD
ncbi:hypothetical protein GCK72_021449 [Caenorhabditis remanei]|uniref:F-box domain-containing protein n=1 Tax=Caenorhabditis remanei TaxID=31234 RepID=A0A6A5GJH3_CAERE|nr:hypothetical protein GCK72_021449 [Caenorhabditis remanei]KAF1754884.1 hypothetical protein GCK72_021449 [Caenorhabditis remanei]